MQYLFIITWTFFKQLKNPTVHNCSCSPRDFSPIKAELMKFHGNLFFYISLSSKWFFIFCESQSTFRCSIVELQALVWTSFSPTLHQCTLPLHPSILPLQVRNWYFSRFCSSNLSLLAVCNCTFPFQHFLRSLIYRSISTASSPFDDFCKLRGIMRIAGKLGTDWASRRVMYIPVSYMNFLEKSPKCFSEGILSVLN